MKKLALMIENSYGDEEYYNCAERILAGANEAYGLGLPLPAVRMAAGMGGGMGRGELCGAVNASAMVLGRLYARDVGRRSPEAREKVKNFLAAFEAAEGSLQCAQLRATRMDTGRKCHDLILRAAAMLDEIVEREPPPPGLA